MGQSMESLTVLGPLRFGTIAVLGSGGVTMLPQGTRLADGQAFLVGPDGGSPAQILVTSRQPNMSFSLSLPSSFTLVAQGSQDVLVVTNLSKAPLFTTTGPAASATVTIGGTLQFSGVPSTGVYVGSFPVSLIWP